MGAGRIYIYLNGLLVGLVDGNRILDVETDHLGRPELVLHGQVIKWRAVNTALGRRLVTSSESLDVGFPGQLFDSETGLWHNWHRYYDASIGRYIQSDLIGLSGGLNLYAYAANNPTSLDDPAGLIAPAVYYAGVLAASILTAKSCMEGMGIVNGVSEGARFLESR